MTLPNLKPYPNFHHLTFFDFSTPMKKMDVKRNNTSLSKFVVVLILWCCRHNCILASSGPGNDVMCKEEERAALLSFKQGLVLIYGAVLLESWGDEDDKKECCDWEGIICSNTTGRVTGLQVQYVGGKISPSIVELRHLYNLDLSHNEFGRNSIPEFISSLSQLRSLNLNSCNMSGEVPFQLRNLTNLRTLDLGQNHGLTSNNLSWLSNLTSLSKLDLSANQFSGSVPDLTMFSSLRELRLGENELTELPMSIFQLSELEILDLSHNHFEGTVSDIHLSKLDNLKVLDLSFNSLVLNLSPDWVPPFQLEEISLARCDMGTRFPAWLQTQSNFSHLDLSAVGISDDVPDWLWELSPQMAYLNLSLNQITGPVPNLLSKSIEIIDISFNNFSGNVPLFHSGFRIIHLSQNMFSGSIQLICRVTYDSLRMLDLSKNQLSGVLPNCWENMTDLLMLNLAENKFSGHFPHSFGSLIYLRILLFRDNNFTGELPSLEKCRFLQFIDGGGNELTGNLPIWFQNLTDLGFLVLRKNNFYGSIPLELCSLTLIQVLDLSQNKISGRIPQCFGNFASLNGSDIPPFAPFFLVGAGYDDFYGLGSYVNDAIVQWKRQESQYKSTLGLLKLVDLSSNKLVDDIPHEISVLSTLGSLNLSRNFLTGNIMSDIDQMKMLQALDLSKNNLSGEIPIGLAELHYLGVLDLSNNSLSGRIPRGTQLQSFDPSAYAGNGKLCGAPLLGCPGDDPRPPAPNRRNQVDIDDQNDHSFMIESLFPEFYISAVVGYMVALLVFVGPLLFKRSWRQAYFRYWNKIGDWLYVTVAIWGRRFRDIFKLS